MVAVSCDQGDHIIIPSGRVMEGNPFWLDADGGLNDKLTMEQTDALQRALNRFDSSPLGEITRNFSRNRKAQERLDGIVEEKEHRVLSDNAKVIMSSDKERE